MSREIQQSNKAPRHHNDNFESDKRFIETVAELRIKVRQWNVIQLSCILAVKFFFAVLENNSSAMALKELLAKCNVTVEMSDYAHMEKVGTLGVRLPRNDEWIQTDSGDLILYQGHYMVIYYDRNSYSLTRLGKIINVTQDELKNALGKGNVSVVLSLE